MTEVFGATTRGLSSRIKEPAGNVLLIIFMTMVVLMTMVVTMQALLSVIVVTCLATRNLPLPTPAWPCGVDNISSGRCSLRYDFRSPAITFREISQPQNNSQCNNKTTVNDENLDTRI